MFQSWLLFFLLFFALPSFSQNLGFQYKDGYCQKKKKPGHNPNYKGECGQKRKMRIRAETWSNESLLGIIMDGSLFYRSHLTKVDMSYAFARNLYISETTFTEVKAQSVNWKGTRMKGAFWKDSDLKKWYAPAVRIEKSKFINCDLRDSDFWGASLFESDFSGSDLRGANLSSTFTAFTKFTGAQFNGKTILPFSKEEALKKGMIEVD